MRTTALLVVLAVALGGCAMNREREHPRDFDEAAIRAAERALERALQSPDPTAWVYLYAEDAVFAAPGALTVQGRPALLQMAKTMKPLSSVVIRPLRTEGSAGLAAVYAQASWISGQPSEGGSISKVRAIMVWRKEADGQWRVAQELLHADPAGNE
jgi:uncharacterized protein (TIGR02246 family)